MLLPEISRPMPIFYLFLFSLVDLLRGAVGVRERGIERVRRQSLRTFVESHRIIASRAAASSTKKKTASPLARATPPHLRPVKKFWSTMEQRTKRFFLASVTSTSWSLSVGESGQRVGSGAGE